MAKRIALVDNLQDFPNQLNVETEQATLSPKDEQQLNVWISKDLMKRLKMKGAEADMSLKQMAIEALEQFLERN